MHSEVCTISLDSRFLVVWHTMHRFLSQTRKMLCKISYSQIMVRCVLELVDKVAPNGVSYNLRLGKFVYFLPEFSST